MHWAACLCVQLDTLDFMLYGIPLWKGNMYHYFYMMLSLLIFKNKWKVRVGLFGERHLSCWTSIHSQGNTLTDGSLEMWVCTFNFIGKWSRKPLKKNRNYGEKRFHRTSFQLGMDQKQGKDERTQEDYPTNAVYFCRCRVVLCPSLSALFLSFFQVHP